MESCCWVGADPGVSNFSRGSKDLLDLQEQKGLQATRQVSYHSLCLSSLAHRHFIPFSVCLFPTIYPIPSFSVLANSSMVRDVKDLARVLGAIRKDKVRPLESKREPWIYQGECRIQPGVDFGREGRNEGQGWVQDRVRCNRSWSVGEVEGGAGERLMVSELSPQLWGSHWGGTDLKEDQQCWTVKGEGKPDTFTLPTAVVSDGSQEGERSSELFAC